MRTPFYLLTLVLLASLPMSAQKILTRDETRDLLRASLDRYGPETDVNISFHQSDKQPYNFVGVMTAGMKNVESLEVVAGISADSTINVAVYPGSKAAI